MVKETFDRIIRQNNDDTEESYMREILHKYSPEELSKKFIVFLQKSCIYYVYNSVDEFLAEFETLPEDRRVFHEFIYCRPQKLKFDIDIEVCSGDDWNEKKSYFDKVFFALCDEICYLFKNAFNIELKKHNLFIAVSHGPEKLSAHIIITGYYVSDTYQAKNFANLIKHRMKSNYLRAIDWDVYKRLQNFRLPLCHKDGSARTLKIITEHTMRDGIITDLVGCEKLPSVQLYDVEKKDISYENINMNENLLAQIRMLEINFPEHKLRKVSGNKIEYDRITSSHCNICECRHDHDNTHMLAVQKIKKRGKEIYSVFQCCRKAPGRRILIQNIQIDEADDINYNSDGEETDVDETETKVGAIKFLNNAASNRNQKIIKSAEEITKISLLFDKLDKKCINRYSEPKLRLYEDVDNLCVHAGMKMGKTKMLSIRISDLLNSPLAQLRPPNIMFLSFRQTFSGNIKEQFPDFTLYSDIKGEICEPRLIVQIESLYRVAIGPGYEPPDLLILDECESIFEQFDSSLIRNINITFAKFQWLMRHAKRLICMDANMSDRTFNILKKMRKDFGQPGNTIYHRNEYKNAESDKFYFAPNLIIWWRFLEVALINGDKCAIPISSLKEGKNVAKWIKTKFPDKKIKLYSSETLMSEKRKHFSDVNSYWSQYDVLIYTPSVTAGVSFELEHYDKMFCYFINLSCSAETCTQMIGRIRNIKSKEYYVFLDWHVNYLPETESKIKDILYRQRTNLLSNFDTMGLFPEYDTKGNLFYPENDYFQLWIENTKVRNKSRNNFMKCFVQLIVNTGAKCKEIDCEFYKANIGCSEEEDEHLCYLHEERKFISQDINKKNNTNVAAAIDINNTEASLLENKIIAQEDMTKTEHYQLVKYKLREHYNYRDNITSSFVEIYKTPKIKRIYRNLVRLYAHGMSERAIDKTLAQIQKEEKEIFENSVENMSYREKDFGVIDVANAAPDPEWDINNIDAENLVLDLRRRYVFDQHRYAIGLLRLCGWTRPDDTRVIHRLTILGRLIDCDNYWKYIHWACEELMINPPDFVPNLPLKRRKSYTEEMLPVVLAPIVKIVNIIYGVSLRPQISNKEMYFICLCPLFDYLTDAEINDTIVARQNEEDKNDENYYLPIVRVGDE